MLKKNLSKKLYPTSLILSALLISACGGSGSESKSDTDSKQQSSFDLSTISIEPLPFVVEVMEGDTVQLTLNSSGNSSDILTYTWTLGDPDISFTGQGSNSITFTAPDVEKSNTISVEVELGHLEAKLLGENTYRSSVVVFDPSAKLASFEIGKHTYLPKVETLDLSGVLAGSTWQQYYYSTLQQLNASNNVIYNHKLTVNDVVYIKEKNDLTLKYETCATTSELSTDFSQNYDESASCSEKTINYYQQGDSFRVESVCDGEVQQAHEFTKISDTTETNLASLSLNFTSHQNLQTDQGCGYWNSQGAESVDTGEMEYFTQIGIVTSYMNEELTFLLHSQEPIASSILFFDPFFNDGVKSNAITISSPVLPEWANRHSDDDGKATIKKFSFNNLSGDFDTTITDANGNVEAISGSFTITNE